MKKVIEVAVLPNYRLELVFENAEKRIFDASPYLGFGIFSELKDENYFKNISLKYDSVAWQNGQDFSPETLYIRSSKITYNS
ncbi:MAG: DUF2442 domain-containing protein [Bacteroidetes bacterium]|nr:MAG: DUF2442 domain-containing protein [Bacteroidota bacterium]